MDPIKPGKIRNFQEIWQKNKNKNKIIIIIILIIIRNCYNGLGKPEKFSKIQMMKWTSPLDSSREI